MIMMMMMKKKKLDKLLPTILLGHPSFLLILQHPHQHHRSQLEEL
jgi:hypothetical protein